MESTLSFLGLGLPVELVSWGSMLSLSQRALLTNSWWVILIPGLFIIVTLICITNLGHYVRHTVNRNESNL
jgi:peptide/nickel transport system permease protein